MTASQINSYFPFHNLMMFLHVSKTPLLAYGGRRKNFNRNIIKSMLSSRSKKFYMGVLDTFFFSLGSAQTRQDCPMKSKTLKKCKSSENKNFWPPKILDAKEEIPKTEAFVFFFC